MRGAAPRQVTLPLLGPKAAGWQMSSYSTKSCTVPACPFCPPHEGCEHSWAPLSPSAARALQVLTQAPAGSRIKGTEAWVAVTGVCPRAVDAELAAVVQALSTLVDVWRWGREQCGVTACRALLLGCRQGCLLHPSPSRAAHLAAAPVQSWARAALTLQPAPSPGVGRAGAGWGCSPAWALSLCSPRAGLGRSTSTALPRRAQQRVNRWDIVYWGLSGTGAGRLLGLSRVRLQTVGSIR